MTTIAIHQPNYLPYLGFFDKMNKADIFILYDDAQFSTSDFHHRNKIRTREGWKWLTVPVGKRNVPLQSRIKDIKIRSPPDSNGLPWHIQHFNSIKYNYAGTPYYDAFIGGFKARYKYPPSSLALFNLFLIDYMKGLFNIDTRVYQSSSFPSELTATCRLIQLVQAFKGDVYLSGPGGRDYLDESLFNRAGIELRFQEYDHPEYPQAYEPFIPYMSAIDKLFNDGGSLSTS